MAILTFLGATGTVTGSRFLLEADGQKLLIDCGLFQGLKSDRLKNWDSFPCDPSQIDRVLLTHAHIDHTGLLPLMARKGFRGPVYATEPTGDLLKILLLDSAHIQETEAGWKIKKLQRWGKSADVTALYTTKDAEVVAPLVATKKYNEMFSPAPGISVRFQDASQDRAPETLIS